MSYKSVDILIDDARTSAEEKDFSATTGISDLEVLRHLNQGKNIIYRKLINLSQNIFSKSVTIPITKDQKTVPMPIDIYGKNRIRDVKILENGNIYQLKYATEKHDLYKNAARPIKYYRQADAIQLVPTNSKDRMLQLTYIYSLPTLDKVSAFVGSVSIVDNIITSLVLDNTKPINFDQLNKFTSISIVNRKGEAKASAIDIEEIDPATGIVTVSSDFVLRPGETISINDAVMAGPFTSTHTGLSVDVEEYIVEYAIMKMLQRQGSAELAAQAQLVLALETSITDTYSNIADDVPSILVTDFDSDGWSW